MPFLHFQPGVPNFPLEFLNFQLEFPNFFLEFLNFPPEFLNFLSEFPDFRRGPAASGPAPLSPRFPGNFGNFFGYFLELLGAVWAGGSGIPSGS